MPAARDSGPPEQALGIAVAGLFKVITAIRDAVDQGEAGLAVAFDQHQLAPILGSEPGLGPVLAARVLPPTGDDSTRFARAAGPRAVAGSAPVTRASGPSHYVKARKVRNRRLGDACHWRALATLTRSPGARAHYDRRRAAGPPQRCPAQPRQQ